MPGLAVIFGKGKGHKLSVGKSDEGSPDEEAMETPDEEASEGPSAAATAAWEEYNAEPSAEKFDRAVKAVMDEGL